MLSGNDDAACDLAEAMSAFCCFICWQKVNSDTRMFHSVVLFNGRKYTSSLWYVRETILLLEVKCIIKSFPGDGRQTYPLPQPKGCQISACVLQDHPCWLVYCVSYILLARSVLSHT